jgi:hypothetical protein
MKVMDFTNEVFIKTKNGEYITRIYKTKEGKLRNHTCKLRIGRVYDLPLTEKYAQLLMDESNIIKKEEFYNTIGYK